jgi:4-amino-4-deoxy-L-arabinose transferase-like glycosyltransferase
LKPSVSTLFWILCTVVGGLLFLPQLLNEGMFFDGLAYSTIAHNLANDQGSLWKPVLSTAMWDPFYGHPALVMFIESFFFRLLGDGWFTERWFCIFILLISIFLMHKIWKELFPDFVSLSWLPILLWLITPGIYTFYARNLLEPTMGVFTLLAILSFFYALRKSIRSTKVIWLILSSLSVLLAFLCKGLPALFPLAMPLVYASVTGRWNLRKGLILNVLFILLFLSLGAILFSFDDPRSYILGYLETQVFDSVSGKLAVHPGGHLHIIWVFFEDASYMTLITLLLVYWSKKKFKNHEVKAGFSKEALFLIALAICASFPVALSPKQSSFYILNCFAPLALGIAGLRADVIHNMFQKLELNTKFKKTLTAVVIPLLAVTIAVNVLQYKKVRPADRAMLSDVKLIRDFVPKGSQIGTDENSFKQVSSIHAYLQRYGQISLDTIEDGKPYILRKNDTIPSPNREEIEIGLQSFKLYKPVSEIQIPD